MFNALTGEEATPDREIADIIDTDIINELITGELGTLHGLNIIHSSVDEYEPPAMPKRHDWWNQGRKY